MRLQDIRSRIRSLVLLTVFLGTSSVVKTRPQRLAAMRGSGAALSAALSDRKRQLAIRSRILAVLFVLRL